MAVHTVDHVRRCQFTAVMERHTLSNLEGVLGSVVINAPLFGELRVQAHVIPDLDEPVVHRICTRVVDGGCPKNWIQCVVRPMQVGCKDH